MKKNYLYFIVGFILFGLMAAAGINWYRNSKIVKLPQTALLTLETEDRQVKTKDEFVVTLSLDSGNLEVAAADFVLKFDPEKLEVTDVTTGNFFSNYPIKTSTKDSVKISGVATFDGETIILPKGKDTVGLVTFRAKSKGLAELSFDGKKTIVATDGQNILNSKKLSLLEVNISD